MAIEYGFTDSNEVTITLGETFDFSSADEFRGVYEGIDKDSTGSDGNKRFVVDFKNTHYMDSSALGMLISMEKYWRSGAEVIQLINTNPQIRKLFVISHVDKKFDLE